MNLKASDAIVLAASGQKITNCSGEVDRAKAERFLVSEQYDAVHFIGHGDLSILEWSDGMVEESELLGMLRNQRALRYVAITACNSAGVGTAIHNEMHVPVVMCQAPIAEDAAIRYFDAFYRSLRLSDDLAKAHASGRAVLMKTYPAYADVVQLINGDMATDYQLHDCMTYVKTELGEMRAQLSAIEADVKELKGQQPKTVVAGLVLLGLLLVAQLVTPWLNAILVR